MDYALKIYTNKISLFECLRTNHFINFYLVIDGEIIILKNNNFQRYQTKDIFYIHDYESVEGIQFEGKVLCLTLNNYYYYQIPQYSPYSDIIKLDNDDFKQHFKDVILSLLNYSSPLKTKQALWYLIKSTYLSNQERNTYFKPKQNYKNTLIRDVVSYVNKYCKNKLTCHQIAEYFFVNNTFLSREFSALMSCTLSNYIVATKIHFSTCDLLNGMSLNTLWQDYHFRSFNDYINYFQTIKGVAPYKIKISTSSLEHIQHLKLAISSLFETD